MARATTRTLLSLDRWATRVGINPVHFNQVQVVGMPSCEDVILQYPWQSAGRVSREDIAQAIARAESALCSQLGYDVAPRWNVDDLVGIDTWKWSGRTSKGMLIGGGVEALSLITPDVDIVYDSVLPGDHGLGYDEVATVQVATSVTDPSEIAVFYPASVLELLGISAGDYTWEIRPTRVSISSGTATIKFRREQVVLPEILEGWSGREVDGLDDDNFLGLVDVYRHYNDPSTQVEFRYKEACCLCDSSCAQCVYGTFGGCLLPVHYRAGFVELTPSTWDGNAHIYDNDAILSSLCASIPVGAALNYKAGYINNSVPTGQMDPELEQIVAHLALSYLGQSLCSCSGIENKYEYYTQDLTKSGIESWGLPANPFGTTRAAFEAWEYVKNATLYNRKVKHA